MRSTIMDGEKMKTQMMLGKDGKIRAGIIVPEGEIKRLKAMIGWLAECAAKQGCPVNEIACDKYLNAGCECPESANPDYRKHCWEHAASAVIAARKEQDNA